MTDAGRDTVFKIDNLEAWYGESQALHGMSFSVERGQTVCLLGRNGAGKTTALRSIMGILRKRRGSIVFQGVETIDMLSRNIARMGLSYVPEERGIYASLSVEENLLLPPVITEGGLATPELLDMFPNLKSRLHSQGSKLSGGEQQMLAIARVLRTGSRVLLLDEPTEGLAPVIVQQIKTIVERLKGMGHTIILVEQNLRFAASVADRHFVIEQGRVLDSLDGDDFETISGSLGRYLSL